MQSHDATDVIINYYISELCVDWYVKSKHIEAEETDKPQLLLLEVSKESRIFANYIAFF